MLKRYILAVGLLATAPAMAEEREFCANRPGLNTPACTLAPGDAMVEVGLAEWDHDSDALSVTDAIVLGDVALRLGIDQRTEAFVGFTPYVRERVRDRVSGAVAKAASTGDVTLGLRHGLAGPNGPVAVQAYATLPVGKAPGGAGTWSAGLALPIGHELPQGFQLALTPELDLAANGSGRGRHLAYGSAIGLSHPLGASVSLTVEAAVIRDDDPAGHATNALAAASLAWQVARDFQLDLEVDKRLAGGVPGHAVMFGFAKRLR